MHVDLFKADAPGQEGESPPALLEKQAAFELSLHVSLFGREVVSR